jgi:hypothetical protein
MRLQELSLAHFITDLVQLNDQPVSLASSQEYLDIMNLVGSADR